MIDRFISLPHNQGQIEMFDHLTVCKQMTDVELLVLHNNTWNPFSCVQTIVILYFAETY